MTISNVSTTSVTSLCGVVVWDTDSVADSSVTYGLTHGGPYTKTAGLSSTPVLHHVIVANDNIMPGSTVYYKVASNFTLSPENTFVLNSTQQVTVGGPLGFWADVNNNTSLDHQMLYATMPWAGLFILDTQVLATPGVADTSWDDIATEISNINSGALRIYYTNQIQYTTPAQRTANWRTVDEVMSSMTVAIPYIFDQTGPQQLFLGDMTDTRWNTFMSTNIIANLYAHPKAQGIHLDLSTRKVCPHLGNANMPSCAFSTYTATVPLGDDVFWANLRSNITSTTTLFYNGIWNGGVGFVGETTQDMKLRMDQTDGNTFESFALPLVAGTAPNNSDGDWNNDLLPFLQIMSSSAYTNRYRYAIGRVTSNYNDVIPNYLWQRYVTAAFKLASGPSDMIHVIGGFTHPQCGARDCAMEMYADQIINWGNPIDVQLPTPTGAGLGMYVRRFQNATVIVGPQSSPAAGTTWTYSTPQTMWTPEGTPVSGVFNVGEGTGYILLNAPQSLYHPFYQDFEGSDAADKYADLGTINTDGTGNHYLSVAAHPNPITGDLLLDWQKTLTNGTTIQFQYRTSDPTASMWWWLGTDDVTRSTYSAVISMSTSTTPSKPYNVTGSTTTFAYRFPSTGGKQVDFVSNTILVADGAWHTLTYVPTIADSNITIRQIKWARIFGAIDFDNFKVTGAYRPYSIQPAVAGTSSKTGGGSSSKGG